MASVEEKEAAMDIREREDWSTFTPERIEELIARNPAPAVGYLVWTRAEHGPERVCENIAALKARGITHIRTGIAWAEWVEPGGAERIGGYIRAYAESGLNVLPCLAFTPPRLGLEPAVNSPPKDERRYADFVEAVESQLGSLLECYELENEWNLNTDWDPTLDPGYWTFTNMIRDGAQAARRHRKRVLLGGASKVNRDTLYWYRLFAERGLRERVDVLGFHNLRGTWSDHIPSPPMMVQARLLRQAWGVNVGVWLTEYGFPPVDPEKRFDLRELEQIQIAVFAYAVYAVLSGAVERAYLYTYKDEVHQSLRQATTGWEDELQYYFGDTREDGVLKPLGELLTQGGPVHVLRHAVREGLMPLVDKAALGRKIPGM